MSNFIYKCYSIDIVCEGVPCSSHSDGDAALVNSENMYTLYNTTQTNFWQSTASELIFKIKCYTLLQINIHFIFVAFAIRIYQFSTNETRPYQIIWNEMKCIRNHYTGFTYNWWQDESSVIEFRWNIIIILRGWRGRRSGWSAVQNRDWIFFFKFVEFQSYING